LLKRHNNFSFNTVELGVNEITLRPWRSPKNGANDVTQGFQPSKYCPTMLRNQKDLSIAKVMVITKNIRDTE
jgi:hypothetical protein